jgi:mannose-6-phosphate isomerase-like protein (cupin superfamily)
MTGLASSPYAGSALSGPVWHVRVDEFRRATLDVLRLGAATDGTAEIAAECAAMAELLSVVDAVVKDPQPRLLPGVRFLKDALKAVQSGHLRRLAESTAAVEDGLHWRNKYPQSQARLYDRFGFCDLVGPDGVQPSDHVTLGLVIVGPNTNYPLHEHPARELYLVLSGSADWAVDDAPFAPRPPGSLILHREMQPHAMRTGDETLLALSMWRGEIRARSQFTRAPT